MLPCVEYSCARLQEEFETYQETLKVITTLCYKPFLISGKVRTYSAPSLFFISASTQRISNIKEYSEPCNYSRYRKQNPRNPSGFDHKSHRHCKLGKCQEHHPYAQSHHSKEAWDKAHDRSYQQQTNGSFCGSGDCQYRASNKESP